ncbi:MAG: PKD domain-containing protein [Bacteroidia bacterium]
MKKKLLFLLLFLTSFSLKNFATHIVGGEIYYDNLGGNNYRITLKVYRDCLTGLAPYDDPACVFIFNSAGTFIDSLEIPFPGSAQLPVTISNPCFTPPTNICVEEAIYQTTVNLPNIPGGYDLTYQRCCRNGTILNLIAPGNVGSTYMAHIPDNTIAPGNSSPRFNNFPPIFLCSGVPLYFDHSATDPDGDSLDYEVCDPYTGLDPSCPSLGPAAPTGCAAIASPPPYAFVPWLAPYSGTYPMSSSPALAVDPVTGLMTGTPNMLGQWVVGVCVSEYRHGVLIDINKRDFQFNVVNCPGLPVASIPLQTTFCFGYNVNFTQASINATTYHWDFGDPTTTADTSNLMNPSWTYSDSGTYHVTLIINPGTLCADTNSTTFYIYPLLSPNFVPPAGQCIDNNSFDFTAGGAFMGDGTFTWNFGVNATPSTSNLQNPTHIVFSAPGTYPVSLTVSENGCTQTVAANVVVYPKPVANYGLSSGISCSMQPVAFVDSSATAPLTYQWTFGDGTFSTAQNPVHMYPSTGSFNSSLIVTSSHGCKDTFALSAPINIFPSPQAGFNVSPHDTSIFYPQVTTVDISTGAVSCDIFWGDGASSTSCDTVHDYTHPGTYEVMQVVTNALGCTDTAYSQVIIEPEFLFWIPNAFTPNGNGLNDIFKPKILGVHNYSFLIFDRWGQKIFETTDMNDGWNGYYKSRLCEQDVYVYKITFVDDVEQANHKYIGRVTLVR